LFHVLKDLEITLLLFIFSLQVKKIYITTGMFSSDINLAGKFRRNIKQNLILKINNHFLPERTKGLCLFS